MNVTKISARMLTLLALVAGLALPASASAQSQLDASQATAFIGAWTLNFNSDQGAFAMSVAIRDQGGKVAATLTQADMGMQQEVTDIAKDGESLVLSFAGDFQGQAFAAAISIAPPAGNESEVWFDINDGQFGMPGTGTKAAN
jgi:hypothetical protein